MLLGKTPPERKKTRCMARFAPFAGRKTKGEMPLKQYEPIDAETLLSTPLPPVRWLIPDLLPAGLSLLAGASKAGKSWLCLWMCLQLAKGGEIWNRTVPPQTVLYLCLEDTFARIQARLFRLTEDAVPERLYFQTGSETIGNGLEVQIEKFLAAHQETALVVIDTLQKVRSAEPMNGSYASDYQDMSALKALADRHRIGILLVHHLKKQGAADPFHQISGSNGLMGAADTIWLLQHQRMSSTARLLVTGRDMDSRTLHLQRCYRLMISAGCFHYNAGIWFHAKNIQRKM